MLMLLFRVGKERYALDTTLVVEVIPKVDLIKYHGTQPAIAGRFNYQGRIVPVLDLSQFLAGEPCPAVLSTRIVIVDLDIRQPLKFLNPIGVNAIFNEQVSEAIGSLSFAIGSFF
ncbi:MULTISPECIES: chemotaxis protein CheW [Spirulina sp. CCY15215]|uniref:chemotaxis protein CheW n=1 Tax=Spirulina sp. CCY15215 TaxID=2767591 RepID=UPI00194DDFFF|nr:chemotaxis protein CheW [Spirulina major]